MPEINVVRYKPSLAAIWNRAVAEARNGHFLFDRRFMEYHADRFADSSLLFFAGDRLLGVMPANRRDDILYSHQGLTFGGIVASDRLGASLTLPVFEALWSHLAGEGIRALVYKPLPPIYHHRPAQDDLYALFRQGAELVRRDVSTTIDYAARVVSSKGRRKGVRKAARAGLLYRESDRWDEFWAILVEVLADRHHRRPVHTLSEMRLLHARFPEAIRLFAALSPGGDMLAGVVMFNSGTVAHAQYSATSAAGRAACALDGLFRFLIEHYRRSKRWFDFGISTEDEGRVLNTGLAKFKEQFGGCSTVYDVYRLAIR
jgi:Acetyltransferase (GNAT) domain